MAQPIRDPFRVILTVLCFASLGASFRYATLARAADIGYCDDFDFINLRNRKVMVVEPSPIEPVDLEAEVAWWPETAEIVGNENHEHFRHSIFLGEKSFFLYWGFR